MVAVAVAALNGQVYAKDAKRRNNFEQYVTSLPKASAAPSPWLQDCKMLVTPHGDVRRPCVIALADLVPEANATLKIVSNRRALYPHSLIS